MTAQGSTKSRPGTGIGLLTTRIRQQIIDAMDLGKASLLGETELRKQVEALSVHLCEKQEVGLVGPEKDDLVQHIIDEIYGLGPLQPLLDDSRVSAIIVNGFNNVQVERDGSVEKTPVSFGDDTLSLIHI